MPRANRHFIQSQVWHITHRCHKQEFLLKFGKDRKRWQYWLFESKRRYGLQVLNYVVTSNHIHLLVMDNGDRDVLPKSIQLIAGRTGQEFNQRKNRRGAFWEDRYHATAIESGGHLIRCMVYIDLNMVRAGVVNHPSEWPDCEYHEIQKPRQRYSIIDFQNLMELTGVESIDSLKREYAGWISEALQKQESCREAKWTESIAIGSEDFIDRIKDNLGIKVTGRKKINSKGSFELREPEILYKTVFDPEIVVLRPENMHYWIV